MMSTTFEHNSTLVVTHGLLWALIVVLSWYEGTLALASVFLNYVLVPAPPNDTF